MKLKRTSQKLIERVHDSLRMKSFYNPTNDSVATQIPGKKASQIINNISHTYLQEAQTEHILSKDFAEQKESLN